MRLCRLAVLLAVFAGISSPAAAQYTSKSKPASSGFTTSSTARSSADSDAKKAPAQGVFRPRPQAEQPKSAASNDDELPSFEALESKNSEKVQNAGAPSAPPPKGEIWFYKTNFHYENLTGMPETMNCEWDVVVQNKTDTPIDRLVLTYYLFDRYFVVKVPSLAPNASFVDKNIIFSPQCPAMRQTKPKMGVKKCKMGSQTDQECLKYIVLK